MNETMSDIGMIGLAVMGRNLVLNMAEHGVTVSVYNRTESVTRAFVEGLEPGWTIRACYSIPELIGSLKRPRRIMLMVKAGKAVDAVIDELTPYLQAGDIVIDGGNSHFTDTAARERLLAEKGVHFLGVGISGGEFGARTGPSMMPGGAAEAYEVVRPVFEAITARVQGEPCVAYMGPGAAGHYVKMVHNGIEYGLMQLIAETYALMKQGLGLSNDGLAGVYAEWNAAELRSYLVEITADIMRRRDQTSGGHLVDVILAEAGQLGTGMWTSQSALDLGVPVPTIDAAVSARSLSASADTRRSVAAAFAAPGAAGGVDAGAETVRSSADPSPAFARDVTVDTVRNALYAAMIVTYAQGFAQLRSASAALGLSLSLQQVAAVWRGGCIIRADLLESIRNAFVRQPDVANLLADPALARTVTEHRLDLARAVVAAASDEVSAPCLSASLAYIDSIRAPWLPANLIQAQRDYFGAHTYLRVDMPGVFHTDWQAEERKG